MADTVDLGVPSLAETGTAEIPPLDAPTLEPTDPIDPPPGGDSAPPKRRRRRTKKADSAPAPAVDAGPSPDDIGRLSVAFAAAFKVVGSVLAAARGPHWNVDDQETKALGDAWAVAWAPYMGGAGRYMPFVVAGVTTVGVFLPRVQEDQRRAKMANAGQVEMIELPAAPVPEVSPSVPGADAPLSAAPTVAPVDAPTIPIDPPAGRKRSNGGRQVSP